MISIFAAFYTLELICLIKIYVEDKTGKITQIDKGFTME